MNLRNKDLNIEIIIKRSKLRRLNVVVEICGQVSAVCAAVASA